MGEDLESAPVPISLSIRHSSGRVATYTVRALAYDDTSLRVISPEDFEQGTRLKVRAPFLEGIVSCQVSAVSRKREHFELDLRFLRKAATKVEPNKKAAQPILPESAARAARELAIRLERGEALPFSQVLQEIHPTRRPLLCSLSGLALILLLQEKTMLDASRLLETLENIAPGSFSNKGMKG